MRIETNLYFANTSINLYVKTYESINKESTQCRQSYQLTHLNQCVRFLIILKYRFHLHLYTLFNLHVFIYKDYLFM